MFWQDHPPPHFHALYAEHEALIWPGELDLAPDAMHAAIKEHGEWTIAP